MDILSVQKIIRPGRFSRVPETPDYIIGVINLRGHILPVMDLRIHFYLAAAARSGTTRIIVMELDGFVVGFFVDAVSDTPRLPVSPVEAAPAPLASGPGSEYIGGVINLGEKILILPDLHKLINEMETKN